MAKTKIKGGGFVPFAKGGGKAPLAKSPAGEPDGDEGDAMDGGSATSKTPLKFRSKFRSKGRSKGGGR